jgi:hypothetical protein
MRAACCGATYPRSLRGVASCGYRCLRRDVGGPIHRPRGNGRRPEGERNGSRSGRPGGNRFRRSLSNEAEPATALAAQGAMASAPATASANRKPKLCPGTQIAGAGAERQPRDREVPGSPSTRLSGRLARVSRGVIAPGLPSRHPRTRRTSGPPAGDGRRVGGCRRRWRWVRVWHRFGLQRCNTASPIAPNVHSPRVARSLAQCSRRFFSSDSKPRPSGS